MGWGEVCVRPLRWQISGQSMVISYGLFIQGLQTRTRTSLSLLGLKGPPTTQPNSSHSALAPISSWLFPSSAPTTQSQAQLALLPVTPYHPVPGPASSAACYPLPPSPPTTQSSPR